MAYRDLTPWHRDKMVAILQTTLSYAYFWMKTFEFKNKISLGYVPWSLIDNKPSSVQIMDCRRTGEKPLPEPVLVYSSDAYMRRSAPTS